MLDCIHIKMIMCSFSDMSDLLFLQVSYSLTQLAQTQLGQNRKEITPHDIPRMFQKSEFLMELVGSHAYFDYFVGFHVQ